MLAERLWNGSAGAHDGSGGRRTRERSAAAAPWFVLVAGLVWLLRDAGVAPFDTARYGGYLVLAVVAPGALVHRALGGTARTWFHEAAWGALTGLSVQFVVWLPLSRVGANQYTWLWAVAVFAGLALTRSGRARLGAHPRERIGRWPAWSTVVLALSVTARVRGSLFVTATPLPPAPSETYQDMWWHLSLVQEVMRPGPPQIPQVAGEALKYHYFAHVDMALSSFVTRIDPAVVAFRLWPVAMILLTVTAVAVAAEWVAGTPRGGQIVAWIACGLTTQSAWWPGTGLTAAGSMMSTRSNTQFLAGAMFIAGVAGLIAVLRGQLRGRQLVWLALLLTAGAGTKSTVAAIWLAGSVSGLAGMAVAARFARRAWLVPRRWIAPSLVLVAALVVMPFSSVATGGQITVLGSLRLLRTYVDLTGDDSPRGSDQGWILDSLVSWRGVVAAIVALVSLAGGHLIRWGGLVLWRESERRHDPGLWFLTGALAAAWTAFFLLDHSGAGQIFFPAIVTPAGALLTSWWVATRIDAEARPIARVIAAGVLLGVGAFLAHDHVVQLAKRVYSVGAIDVIVLPLALALTVVVAAVSVRRTEAGRWVLTGAVPAVAFLALAVIPTVDTNALAVRDVVTGSVEPIEPSSSSYVAAGEQNAARWLRDTSEPDDVVVTNVHCKRPTDDLAACDSRAYWLTALSGRRVVIESWAYTAESQARHLVGGRSFPYQFEPWTDRIELGQALITDGSAEAARRLQREFGVDWVFVDRRYGEPSERLGGLAELVYDLDGIAIYRLG